LRQLALPLNLFNINHLDFYWWILTIFGNSKS
jgi:hypothetical protein